MSNHLHKIPTKQLKGKMLDLAKVYKTFGQNSPEFFDQIKHFVAYVQIRFMGRVDEDLQQQIYLRLVKSFTYYDGKTNIGTWVFSVARHQVSSHIYHHRKRMKESEDGLEKLDDGTCVIRLLQDKERVETFLDSFYDIALELVDGDLAEQFESLSTKCALVRAFMWSRINPAHHNA